MVHSSKSQQSIVETSSGVPIHMSIVPCFSPFLNSSLKPHVSYPIHMSIERMDQIRLYPQFLLLKPSHFLMVKLPIRSSAGSSKGRRLSQVTQACQQKMLGSMDAIVISGGKCLLNIGIDLDISGDIWWNMSLICRLNRDSFGFFRYFSLEISCEKHG